MQDRKEGLDEVFSRTIALAFYFSGLQRRRRSSGHDAADVATGSPGRQDYSGESVRRAAARFLP